MVVYNNMIAIALLMIAQYGFKQKASKVLEVKNLVFNVKVLDSIKASMILDMILKNVAVPKHLKYYMVFAALRYEEVRNERLQRL